MGGLQQQSLRHLRGAGVEPCLSCARRSGCAAGSALEWRGHGSASPPPRRLSTPFNRRWSWLRLGTCARRRIRQNHRMTWPVMRGDPLPLPLPPPRISLAPDPPDVRRTSRRRNFVSASTHALVCRSAAHVCTRAQVVKAESARSADETGGSWLIVMTVRCCSCSSR